MQAWLKLAAVSIVLAAIAFAQPQTYTIVARDGRRPLPFRAQGGQDLVALSDIASAFGLTVREDVAAGGIVVTAPQNRTIVLTPGQPLVSVAGRVVSLPAAPVRDGRAWLVPVEFISRAVGPALNTRLDVRRPTHLIIAGDLRVPEVTITVDSDAARARVTADITPSTPRTVTQDGQRLILRLEADAIDLRASGAEARDIVAGVHGSDAPQNIVIDLGPNAAGFQTSTQPIDRGERVIIEIAAQGAPAQPDVPPATPPGTPEPPPLPEFGSGGLRTVVIDPGHGGDEIGARGGQGIEEKAIALQLAYRLKAALEGGLGVRVLLTRDSDRAVRVDERTSLANNNKADLFISLHANASVSPVPSGAQVLTLAAEGYAAEAPASTAPSVSLPVFGGGTRAIEVIAWDTAQMRWLGDSERLAGLVHHELGTRVPMHPRSLGKAPLRVLIGANMPAVLIEIGFLSNPDQEKALAAEGTHAQIVQALVAAIVRYRSGASAAPEGAAPGAGTTPEGQRPGGGTTPEGRKPGGGTTPEGRKPGGGQ